MAATVTIVEKNGAGATATDKTSGTVRFKNADDATVNTANPMVVPPSGTDYSFEKWLRLKVTGGTYTDISNIRAYMDGATGFGTGIGLYAKAVTAYATPAEATATTGYADAFGYTSGSPLDLAGDGSTGTGEKGDHLVMMMTVASTASGGMLTAETLSIAWDEI